MKYSLREAFTHTHTHTHTYIYIYIYIYISYLSKTMYIKLSYIYICLITRGPFYSIEGTYTLIVGFRSLDKVKLHLGGNISVSYQVLSKVFLTSEHFTSQWVTELCVILSRRGRSLEITSVSVSSVTHTHTHTHTHSLFFMPAVFMRILPFLLYFKLWHWMLGWHHFLYRSSSVRPREPEEILHIVTTGWHPQLPQRQTSVRSESCGMSYSIELFYCFNLLSPHEMENTCSPALILCLCVNC